MGGSMKRKKIESSWYLQERWRRGEGRLKDWKKKVGQCSIGSPGATEELECNLICREDTLKLLSKDVTSSTQHYRKWILQGYSESRGSGGYWHGGSQKVITTAQVRDNEGWSQWRWWWGANGEGAHIWPRAFIPAGCQLFSYWANDRNHCHKLWKHLVILCLIQQITPHFGSQAKLFLIVYF